MTKEQKPFEYTELLVMCMMCATSAIIIALADDYKDEVEGRKMIEDEIKRIVSIGWERLDKKAIE